MNMNEEVILDGVLQEGQLKKAVTLKLSPSGLVIDQEVFFFNSVKIEQGGNNNKFIFIHLSESRTAYFELNTQIINLLEEHPQIYEHFKLFIKHKASHFYTEIVIVLVFFLMISGIVYYRGVIFSQFSVLIPYSFEKKVGDQVFAKDSQSQFTQINKIEDQLKVMLTQLKSFDPQKHTIHVSAKSEINVYATIGGHIFINQGLLKKIEKPEQLIGVIAHEIVHIDQRHVVKNIFQSVGLFVIFQAFLGDVSGLIAVVVDQGGPLLNLSYSRDLETEADSQAVKVLIESQIDPRGLSEALSLIERENQKLIAESPGSKILSKIEKQNFLRSHPQTLDRIESMQKIIAQTDKNNKYKQMNSEWIKIQKLIQEL